MQLLSQMAYEDAKLLYKHGCNISQLVFAVGMIHQLDMSQASEVWFELIRLEAQEQEEIALTRSYHFGQQSI